MRPQPSVNPREWAQASEQARQRIASYIRETPIERVPALDPSPAAQVYLKFESLQRTRSFKLRGALSKLTRLSSDERKAGIVTASSGNHGLAVAFGLRALGIEGTIYLPNTVSRKKKALLEQQGATIALHGDDGIETEEHARAVAEATGRLYVSPYNDADVIAGQGTIGLELIKALPAIDAVYVPVGGGGLIGGIAGVLKAHNPNVRVIGCQPAHSPVMHESIKAGRIVAMPSKPTLSDGTAGGIEVDSVTFPICQALVDEWVSVEEDEIRDAVRWVFESQYQVVEGAAGVAVAALQKSPVRVKGNHVVIICGGNVSMDTFKGLICP